MRNLSLIFLGLMMGLLSCSNKEFTVFSPSSKVKLNFALTGENQPSYSVYFNNKSIIKPSTLGFDFKDMESLGKGMVIDSVQTREFNEKWEMPWGEQRYVTNHYNEL